MNPLAAFVVLLFLIFGAVVNFTTVKRLSRLPSSFHIWSYYSLSVSCGIGLFIWLTFYFSYYPSPTLLFYGAPIPYMFSQLEGSNWTGFPPPFNIQIFIIVSNFFVITAITVTPLLVWTFLTSRMTERIEHQSLPSYKAQ